jgi:hypothetical protein
MMEPPRSYSERRDLIAKKLQPYFAVSSLVPTNTERAFEPDLFENSLKCTWGDPASGENKLFVYIHQVADGDAEAQSIREMVLEESPPTPNKTPPDADAYEMSGQRPGQYVFVLNYLGCLTVIVGNCRVDISPIPATSPVSEIAEAALDIGRTVGCSAYVNDFQPPAFETPHDPPVWNRRWPDLRPANAPRAVAHARSVPGGMRLVVVRLAVHVLQVHALGLLDPSPHEESREHRAHRVEPVGKAERLA